MNIHFGDVNRRDRHDPHSGTDQLGIAVLHEHYKHDSLVVMSQRDFEEWFGGGDGPER